jgi:hypothetical protein
MNAREAFRRIHDNATRALPPSNSSSENLLTLHSRLNIIRQLAFEGAAAMDEAPAPHPPAADRSARLGELQADLVRYQAIMRGLPASSESDEAFRALLELIAGNLREANAYFQEGVR